MTEEKTTALRERMIKDMRIRGMGDKAQKSHIRAIKDFAGFLKRSPDTATPEELRAYQLSGKHTHQGAHQNQIGCPVLRRDWQHIHFSSEQHNDAFVGNYMRWLGHHEFGLDHRPFVFDQKRALGDPGFLDYWLDLWCRVYAAVLEHHCDEVTFVSYDRLCTEPEEIWGALARQAKLPEANEVSEPLVHAVREGHETFSPTLLTRAENLYKDLLVPAL